MTEHWAIDTFPHVAARRPAGARGADPVRALFASSEIFPLAKTGGLADVAGSLPPALSALGIEPTLVMPGYPSALDTAVNKRAVYDLTECSAFGPARVIAGWTPDTGLPVWLIDCPALFARDGGPYQDAEGRDWADNAERFGMFAQAIAVLAANWQPDIVHLNDWQTGLAALHLARLAGPRPATVFTVHNMAFQGVFERDAVARLNLPEEALGPDSIEYFGRVSFLKAGLRYADRLTTVSPTYAREILTDEYGCGLQGLLQERAADLSGILNGIDDGAWNPANDPHLARTFVPRDLSGKRACKASLQRELGLSADAVAPLIVFASRFTEQKMIDCLPALLPLVAEEGAQLALLGEGDKAWEARLAALAATHPGQVAVHVGHDEALAHRMHAGGDILLAPARFEPCGLVQMYGMRYGTVPVVRAVGGLADTVIDATEASLEHETATGFTFVEPTAEALADCVRRALASYRQPIRWRRMQSRAMARDSGWARSAGVYRDLYRQLAHVDREVANDTSPATPLRVQR